MRKNNIMIPKPRSNFVSIQCENCGEKRTIFTHTTMDISCNSCGKPIAQKTGAKAAIVGKIINTLDT